MNKQILILMLIILLICSISIVSAESDNITELLNQNQNPESDIEITNNNDIQDNDNNDFSADENTILTKQDTDILSEIEDFAVSSDKIYEEDSDADADENTILTKQDTDILSDNAQIASYGGFIVDFSNGYRAYCINSSAPIASTNDLYEITSTDVAKNNYTNTVIANYLKMIFYLYPELSLSDNSNDKNLIQTAIWVFTNNQYENYATSNTALQNIIDTVKSEASTKTLADSGETKTNGSDILTFYFNVFIPANTANMNKQSYIGFKYDITNATDQDTSTNTTNETNTTDNTTTNTTENNTTTNTTSNTTENNTTIDTTQKNTTENSTTTDTTQENTTENNNDTNETYIPDNSAEKTVKSSSASETDKVNYTSIKDNTGNPLAVLLVLLSVVGIIFSSRKD